jgi:hypothetical protein
MKRALAALLMLMMASPAFAQTSDWCGSPLPLQADPGTALVWRLRCTIQILDRERIEANDHVTTAEIDKAVAEAQLKAVQGELDALKKKETPPTVLDKK